jgi:hypothetical protein
MRMHGPTKYFFDEPAHDRLLAMILSLGAELAATREELLALRSLLAEKGLAASSELAGPSAASQAERDAMRERLVANLLFPLQQECQALLDTARPENPA